MVAPTAAPEAAIAMSAGEGIAAAATSCVLSVARSGARAAGAVPPNAANGDVAASAVIR